MKAALLSLVGLMLTVTALGGDEPKLAVGTKELRNQCHAYLYFTSALAEEAQQTRMELLTKAIELDPRLAFAYYNRGVLYVNDGDLLRAEADFKKAVELDENYIYAYYNLACVQSMESRPDEALASLEKALAIGYQKFDKIPKDSDLRNIKVNPRFGPLIAKYQARAATAKPTAVQQFQVSDVGGRGQLLTEMLRKPGKQAQDLARWAMHAPNYELRVLSMQLWQKLDVSQTKPALLCGLYDTNGYVSKAAGNCLVSYGKTIEDLMVWILEDKGSPAPLYAMQILSRNGSQKTAEKIVPFLRDDNPNMRTTAAESLARLGAVSALPQVEAAMKNLPKDEQQQKFYKAVFGHAIAELKKAE